MSAQADWLEQRQWKLVLVHRESCASAEGLLKKTALTAVEHLTDPSGDLYAAFGLAKGNLAELLPPKVWWRGLQALMHGHLPGKPGEDIRQLAGAFVVRDGQVVTADRAQCSSDLPNLDKLIESSI